MPVAVPQDLTPELALIFRITHIRNIPWILEHGLHCDSSPVRDCDFVSIGSGDLIPKRKKRAVPVAPGGVLADYIPFYFTPRTPMLYNIKTGTGVGVVRRPMADIAILVTSLSTLSRHAVQFVFTDRHAILATARFSSDLSDLAWLPWRALRESDFARNPDDPGKFEQYQAEVLAYRHVPIGALMGIACSETSGRDTIAVEVANRGLKLDIACRPGWFV